MKQDSIIFISGDQTLEGLSLVEYLHEEKYTNIILESQTTDLVDCFKLNTPEYVFLLGAISGGISANIKKPASLMLSNLIPMIEIINLCLEFKVNKLLYLASSCIYPRDTNIDLSPEMIMTGPLEPTNEGYATTKLIGLKLIKSIRKEYKRTFISVISANCFGPFDDFDSEDAHVVSSLFRKIKEAKTNKEDLSVWGTGSPVRDFIFGRDLASGMVFLMKNYDSDLPINLSTGRGYSIKALAMKIMEICEFNGKILFDRTKPDGMPYKVLDNKAISQLGWEPSISLDLSLRLTYDWYLKNY